MMKMLCMEEGAVELYMHNMMPWNGRGWGYTFLAITLVHRTEQAAGIQVLQPELGSKQY